jgi:hypothetical protein
MKNYIRKIIKEEIQKLFEIADFENAAAQQIATNMSLFKLPRKGIDDSINYFDQLQFQISNDQIQKGEEQDLNDKFDVPALNTPNAMVATNVYESKKVKESYGIYGSTEAAKKNLDYDRTTDVATASFSQDAQDEFDWHNDNIERSLNEIPPGNSRENQVSNNKSKNF